MADYGTYISLSRDSMVEMLYDDDSEQTPYVIAELATRIERGSRAFDDFMDGARGLDSTQKEALKVFCAAIVETLTEGEPDA